MATEFSPSFDQSGICNIHTSSWKHHEYDLLFYGIVTGLRPKVCVELGTLAGYSAYCVATALKDCGCGKLDCYDLWEGYKFNHVPMSEAKKNLDGLPAYLHRENCETVFAHYKNLTVDLLIVDVSNDGYTYEKILADWYKKLTPWAVVIMEGGCEDRDKVEWMRKYHKKPIRSSLRSKFINDHFDFVVFPYFPGVTILRKKTNDKPV